MADIKQILDQNNNEILPITSTEAVFNPDGATTVEGRIQALESYKQKKLVAGTDIEIESLSDTLDQINFTNDSGFINSATNQLLHYYKKNEVYTQEEVDALMNVLSNFQYSVVNALPEPSASTMGIIYIYNGHRYITNEKAGGTYEMIDLGAYDIDLSDYVTDQELDDSLEKRPIFQETTEEQMKALIQSGTWEAGVLYYSVEQTEE